MNVSKPHLAQHHYSKLYHRYMLDPTRPRSWITMFGLSAALSSVAVSHPRNRSPLGWAFRIIVAQSCITQLRASAALGWVHILNILNFGRDTSIACCVTLPDVRETRVHAL